MKVALVGFGTVGRSVYQMLKEAEGFTAGKVLMLPQFLTDTTFQTTDYSDILNDPETDAVVECITDAKCAYEYAKAALQAGKHVVSSSKAMVAVYGVELNKIARENKVAFLFGAACGGSMPPARGAGSRRTSARRHYTEYRRPPSGCRVPDRAGTARFHTPGLLFRMREQ